MSCGATPSYKKKDSNHFRILAVPAGSPQGNAYTYLLYKGLQDCGVSILVGFTLANAASADICHLHWPEYAAIDKNPVRRTINSCLFFFRLCLLKACRAKLVWTVHNLHPHDVAPSRYIRSFYYLMFRFMDGLIFLTHESQKACYRQYPESRSCAATVILHSHYRSMFLENCEMHADCRRERPRAAAQFLFFGLVRRYKNLANLIAVFGRIPRADVRLVCAGEPSADVAYISEIRHIASKDARVELQLNWIPQEDVAALFDAATVIVLPYQEVLNSGVLMLALSLHRPVLAPATDSVKEIQNIVGTEWIMTFTGELTPEILSNALAWAAHRKENVPDLTPFDSGTVTRNTLAFFRDLCGKTKTGNIIHRSA